jgi:hypothetical protein
VKGEGGIVGETQEDFLSRYARSDKERQAMRRLLDKYGDVDPAKADAFAARFLGRDDEYGDPGAARLTAQMLARRRGKPLIDNAAIGALRLMTRATDHRLATREAVLEDLLASTHLETGVNPTLISLAAFPETAFRGFVDVCVQMAGVKEKSPGLLDENGPETAEAREWLTQNANPFAFAVNHFQQTANALRFVNELYRAGAFEVIVDNIQYEDQIDRGGPSSDTLIVRMPREATTRAAVLEVINKDAHDLGVADGLFRDTGQSEVHLWWD